MQRVAVWALAGLLALVGALLAWGGCVLLASGGSAYYLLAGATCIAASIALVVRSGAALQIYGALLAGTLLWGVWEVGLDGWQLSPRLVGPAVIGLLFLLLPAPSRAARSRWWIGGPLLAIIATFAASIVPNLSQPPVSPAVAATHIGPTEWRDWGNDAGGKRYVEADQINTANVAKLTLAWTFKPDAPIQPFRSFEATPLAADGRLYVCLQPGIVAAVDQDTGQQIWRYSMAGFDQIDFTKIYGGKCRGVSYYQVPHPVAECARRILFSSPDGFLRAVDAATGQLCRSFGTAGAVDMRVGMGPWPAHAIEAMPSSPPAIINGVAVIGQTVSDMGSYDAPSGVVRGYDAETGQLKWAWDAGRPGQTLPQPGQNYTRDTPNAWTVLSGDEKLGLVFVPTGGSLPDYYGGRRSPLNDGVSTAVVAIEAATGKVRWVFQTVHHDVWDYDVASQPVAVDIPGAGGATPALLVPTKLGQIFVIDRRTGKPIDPVVERPAPQGGVPDEPLAKTQPYTTGFPWLGGATLTEHDMWGLTPLDQLWCRVRFRQLRYDGPFTPFSATRDVLTYPGSAGGADWGSVSIDPVRGIVTSNMMRLAQISRLIPRKDVPKDESKLGMAVFDMTGSPYAYVQTPFLSPIGVPCQAPPYGIISGLDLKSRQMKWTHSFGDASGSGPMMIPTHLPIPMGVPNTGGAAVTSGGVFFIGATQDHKIRAYDTRTGRELWQATLPAGGQATPVTYVSPKTGRQYVVIASGGHYGIPGPAGRALVAYALPTN